MNRSSSHSFKLTNVFLAVIILIVFAFLSNLSIAKSIDLTDITVEQSN